MVATAVRTESPQSKRTETSEEPKPFPVVSGEIHTPKTNGFGAWGGNNHSFTRAHLELHSGIHRGYPASYHLSHGRWPARDPGTQSCSLRPVLWL